MEIYADVVFAINFFMDLFILWVVCKLSHKKISVFRLVLGGIIMSATYCIIIFVAPFRIYLNIFASVLILICGVAITFKPKSVKEFFKLIFFSYVTAFSIGGLGIALFYFTNISDVIGNMMGFTINNFSFNILLISVCSFYIIIKLSLSWYNRITLKKQAIYSIKIFYDKNDVALTALVDTGNSLHDPITKVPVIIAEFNSIKNFLPDSLKLIFYENKDENLDIVANTISDSGFLGRVRMIPFVSLGKKNGILLGFRPDKVEITSNSKEVIVLKDVVVGIYNYKLTGNNAYQGLLNPELIKEV